MYIGVLIDNGYFHKINVIKYIIVSYTVPLNYNFTVPCVSKHLATRNLQCIPITCLRGPCYFRGVEHTRLI